LDDTGSVDVTISTSNLPSHRHQDASATSTESGGSHSHSGSTDGGGSHTHSIGSAGSHTHTAVDNGHIHDWDKGFPMVATLGPADSCMDIIFVDASHTYHTIPSPHSTVGYANVSITAAGGHQHSIGSVSNHTHVISATSTHSGHTHTLPEHRAVGDGQPVSFKPPSLSLYFYIKM
jgi:hypothetical protein